ncbi:hypothetical protein N0V90_004351 [Kalmusia sp. IMI 367209]|nr:hypothetical protein N0V90_004351 [Kalmusia sp. IMI 367209]
MDANSTATKEVTDTREQAPDASNTRRSTKFGWWWEITSAVFSIACTAAIVAVLVSVNGKSLEHWKVQKIRPNALVAIFSTVAKSALLFPLAECLGQLKWEYFERRARPVNQLQSFDNAKITTGVLTALRNEAYNTSVNYKCPASECKIENVNMLGICSSCSTQTIINTNLDNCVVNFWEGEEQNLEGGTVAGGTYQDLQKYLSSVDSNYATTNEWELSTQCDVQHDEFPRLWLSLHARMLPGDLLNASLEHAGVNIPFESKDDADGGVYTSLQETIMSMSSDNHNIVTNGTDNVDNTTLRYCVYNFTNWKPDEPSYSLIKASCFSSATDLTLYTDTRKIGQLNGTLNTCDLRVCEQVYDSITIRVSTRQKSYIGLKTSNISLPKTYDPTGSLINALGEGDHNYSYSMNVQALDDLRHQFMQIANISGSETQPWTRDIQQPSRVSTASALDDFPLLFDRFAEVLTSVIQSSDNPNTQEKPMEVFDVDVTVEVNWPWMSMPFLIVFLAVVFLVLSIFGNRKKNYLLKTSILAVMYHGLDARAWERGVGEVHEGGREKARESELLQESKKMTAAFVFDEDGEMKLKKD